MDKPFEIPNKNHVCVNCGAPRYTTRWTPDNQRCLGGKRRHEWGNRAQYVERNARKTDESDRNHAILLRIASDMMLPAILLNEVKDLRWRRQLTFVEIDHTKKNVPFSMWKRDGTKLLEAGVASLDSLEWWLAEHGASKTDRKPRAFNTPIPFIPGLC